jgi:predicted hydrocarbon binding protein
MHGILFKSLKDFVVDRHDHETWDEVRETADVPGKLYLPIDTYDDEELKSLVVAVSDRTGEPVTDLLETFGRHTAAQLLETYGNVVGNEESALGLIANAESQIHTVLRARNPDLTPPTLTCRREGDAVRVEYRSDRGLCSVAKGIARGVGDHFDEDLVVSEESCMRDGADHCEIVVRAG